MYIKLGSTKINYFNQSTNDYIIISQVVDSSLSFEKPVLVRNINQLNVWFGKEFVGRNNLVELLEMGATLLLYKPISPESVQYIDGYIDLDNCPKIVVSEGNFSEITSPSDKTIYVIKNKEYIYLTDHSFVLIEDLPQNQDINNTMSLCNRDTLSIFNFTKDGREEVGYISPKYEERNDGGGLISDSSCKLDIENLDFSRLHKGYQTIASSWSLEFNDDFGNLYPPNYDYFVIGDTAIYISPDPMIIFPEHPSVNRKFNVVINPRDVLEKRIHDFKQSMIKFGYRFNNNILIESREDVYEIIELQDFYSNTLDNHTSGLFISQVDDYQYLSSLIYNTTKNDEIISFYSKTIGTSDLVDGNIDIEIENLDSSDLYRITISRFGFSEIFEGNIEGSIENGLSLENLISNQSNLVYCNITTDRGYYRFNKDLESWEKIDDSILSIEEIKKSYVIYDLSTKNHENGDIAIYRKKLPTGSWQLCGAKIENNTPEYYKKSLTTLLKSLETTYPDFLLIPDITKYGEFIDDNDGTYSIYKTILNLSKEIDCQVLIHNNPIEEVKEYNGGFEINGQSQYNYIDDENRLIYFYDNIWIYGEKRPGYYIYLKNLLLNDSYSPSTSDLLYDPPIKDPYLRHFTEDARENAIENYLKKYKTNYLVSNNQLYYYKEFQNGNKFSMSGWMRFCVSKINRELIKNKWIIIENKNEGKIKEIIKSILNNITSSFSMIREINLSNLTVDFNKKTIDITIDTKISDLFNNQLTIDITLNYIGKNKN